MKDGSVWAERDCVEARSRHVELKRVSVVHFRPQFVSLRENWDKGKFGGDLAGLFESKGAGWVIKKTKNLRPIVQSTLAAGQLWRMPGADLRVGLVGKLLVHYKLNKPDVVRGPNSINLIRTVEKFLKKKKAVLV